MQSGEDDSLYYFRQARLGAQTVSTVNSPKDQLLTIELEGSGSIELSLASSLFEGGVPNKKSAKYTISSPVYVDPGSLGYVPFYSGSQLLDSTTSIFYDSGSYYVGIGNTAWTTTPPAYPLDIQYDTNISGSLSVTGSTLITGSMGVYGDSFISGNLGVDGTVTAKELHITYVTSSVLYESGSTKFGNTFDDTHEITGSVMITGSFLIDGSGSGVIINSNTNISGSLTSTGSTGLSGSLSLVGPADLDSDVDISGSLTVTGSTKVGYISGSDAHFTSVETNYVDFTGVTPAHQQGRLYYNEDAHHLAYSTENNEVELHLGQHLAARVKNNSGGTINKGQVTLITGNGIQSTPYVTTASFDAEYSSASTLGVAMVDMDDNKHGYVLLQGVLEGVDTSTYSAGEMLYLSSSGDITNVVPVTPNHEVRIGQVLRVNANSGSIFVRVQNGYEIEELHNVLVQNTSSGDLLVYNDSAGYWENTRQLTGSYGITGSLGVTSGITGSLLGDVTGDVIGGLTGDVQGNVTGSLLGDVQGNVTGSISGSSGVFGALESYGDSFVSGNFAVDGTLTAKEFHTTFVTSSVLYGSGSTKFGDSADDTHEFTGSVFINGATSVSLDEDTDKVFEISGYTNATDPRTFHDYFRVESDHQETERKIYIGRAIGNSGAPSRYISLASNQVLVKCQNAQIDLDTNSITTTTYGNQHYRIDSSENKSYKWVSKHSGESGGGPSAPFISAFEIGGYNHNTTFNLRQTGSAGSVPITTAGVFKVKDDGGNEYFKVDSDNIRPTTTLSSSLNQISGSVAVATHLTASGHVSASVFYGDASGLTNLPSSGITALVDDPSPQLGGTLDVNGQAISGSTVAITGSEIRLRYDGYDYIKVGENSIGSSTTGIQISSNTSDYIRLRSEGNGGNWLDLNGYTTTIAAFSTNGLINNYLYQDGAIFDVGAGSSTKRYIEVKRGPDTVKLSGSSIQFTGSTSISGPLQVYSDSFVSGNFAVDGTLTAKEFHTTFVTSSVLYESGSTKFGDSADDTHEFTGSVISDIGTSGNFYVYRGGTSPFLRIGPNYALVQSNGAFYEGTTNVGRLYAYSNSKLQTGEFGRSTVGVRIGSTEHYMFEAKGSDLSANISGSAVRITGSTQVYGTGSALAEARGSGSLSTEGHVRAGTYLSLHNYTDATYGELSFPNIYLTTGTTPDQLVVQSSASHDMSVEAGETLFVRGDSIDIRSNDGNIKLYLVDTVNDSIQLTGSTGISGDLDVSGDITCTSLTETSARDLKDNVRSMNNELYKVLKLRPVSYDWKETKESDKGFIAEELNEVYPELTSVDDDGKSTGVKYTKMTSVLTRALQELHHIVETQQKEINKLKDELTILRDKDDG